LADTAERPLVAVVGGDTLLAREIRELLDDASPAPRIELISASAEALAIVGLDPDEAVVMRPLSAESLEGARVAFLAGSHASSRKALRLKAEGGPPLIDLTGALEDHPPARLRAPMAEPGPVERRPVAPAEVSVIAHPAAIAVALLLSRIAEHWTIRRSIVHVFEPASERGQRGIDELQQQTIAILSLKKLPTEVFDAQLGFNLLARYGEEALEPFDTIEQRLERDLASLLAAHVGIPMPSLRLIQAPVFHGHSFSVWVEFEENPGPVALSKALEDSGIDVRSDDPPNNVGIAGHSGISVGAISADRNQARACWLWMTADNLRLAAENAVAVAKENL
jgi:aspartate-semialdehyde dehydrogenase